MNNDKLTVYSQVRDIRLDVIDLIFALKSPERYFASSEKIQLLQTNIQNKRLRMEIFLKL